MQQQYMQQQQYQPLFQQQQMQHHQLQLIPPQHHQQLGQQLHYQGNVQDLQLGMAPQGLRPPLTIEALLERSRESVARLDNSYATIADMRSGHMGYAMGYPQPTFAAPSAYYYDQRPGVSGYQPAQAYGHEHAGASGSHASGQVRHN